MKKLGRELRGSNARIGAPSCIKRGLGLGLNSLILEMLFLPEAKLLLLLLLPFFTPVLKADPSR